MFFLKSDGRAQFISPKRYHSLFSNNPDSHILIDVRTPEEYAQSRIAGAINMPVQGLVNRLSDLPHGKPIVVYCRSGSRSSAAVRILSDAGYEQVYDLGGFMSWVAQGLPVVRHLNQ